MSGKYRTEETHKPPLMLILIFFLLSACGTTSVGGKYTYGRVDNKKYVRLDANCDGKCVKFSPDGTCVKWAADMSDVCNTHFERADKIRSRDVTAPELQRVKDIVVSLCRGGTLTGSTKYFDYQGYGINKVAVLKEVVDANGHARIRFSQTEWNGIKADIRRGYSKCAREMMPKFLEKLG